MDKYKPESLNYQKFLKYIDSISPVNTVMYLNNSITNFNDRYSSIEFKYRVKYKSDKSQWFTVSWEIIFIPQDDHMMNVLKEDGEHRFCVKRVLKSHKSKLHSFCVIKCDTTHILEPEQ